MGGQLVFDWDQQENFLVIRDRPVGNSHKYKMPKLSITFAHAVLSLSVPSPEWCTDRRQSVCYT